MRINFSPLVNSRVLLFLYLFLTPRTLLTNARRNHLFINMPSQAAVRNKKRRVEKQKRKQRETEEGTTAAAAAAVRFEANFNKDGAPVGKKVKLSVVADDDIERVARTGAYGSYGANNNNNDERFSIEDDEWATSQRAWNSLAAHLEKFKSKKVWAPFYYDGLVAKRLKLAGFVGKITHEKRDFFKRINDTRFIENVDVVIDNPPYTGKGIKEKILTALIEKDLPFCLLLPLGVLHAKFLRDVTSGERRKKVQAIVPRRVFVHKEHGEELPFKYLVWLCYGLELEKDLVLMDED